MMMILSFVVTCLVSLRALRLRTLVIHSIIVIHSSPHCVDARFALASLALLRYVKVTFRDVGCLRAMCRVLFVRMFGYRTLASRANLGCIDVAKLPSRQSYVSRPVNPHFYMRSSSVEDLSQ